MLEAGSRVRRRAWPDGQIIRAEYRGPGIFQVGPEAIPLRWQPTRADLAADDYEVAPAAA